MYISCVNYLNALDIKRVEISRLLFLSHAAIFTRAASMNIEQAKVCPHWMQFDLINVFFRSFLYLLSQTPLLALPSVLLFYPVSGREPRNPPESTESFLNGSKCQLKQCRSSGCLWWQFLFFAGDAGCFLQIHSWLCITSINCQNWFLCMFFTI